MNWMDEAVRVAHRSSIRTHKSGCVIVSHDKIISKGWSHISSIRFKECRSRHAEIHALSRCNRSNLVDATMFVATVAGASGNITNSRPCSRCVAFAERLGIHKMVYMDWMGNIQVLDTQQAHTGLKVYLNGALYV